MERLDALDMTVEHSGRPIVMSTSATGMPQNAEERVENAQAVIEEVQSKGVPLGDIFVDATVFRSRSTRRTAITTSKLSGSSGRPTAMRYTLEWD